MVKNIVRISAAFALLLLDGSAIASEKVRMKCPSELGFEVKKVRNGHKVSAKNIGNGWMIGDVFNARPGSEFPHRSTKLDVTKFGHRFFQSSTYTKVDSRVEGKAVFFCVAPFPHEGIIVDNQPKGEVEVEISLGKVIGEGKWQCEEVASISADCKKVQNTEE